MSKSERERRTEGQRGRVTEREGERKGENGSTNLSFIQLIARLIQRRNISSSYLTCPIKKQHSCPWVLYVKLGKSNRKKKTLLKFPTCDAISRNSAFFACGVEKKWSREFRKRSRRRKHLERIRKGDGEESTWVVHTKRANTTATTAKHGKKDAGKTIGAMR